MWRFVELLERHIGKTSEFVGKRGDIKYAGTYMLGFGVGHIVLLYVNAEVEEIVLIRNI